MVGTTVSAPWNPQEPWVYVNLVDKTRAGIPDNLMHADMSTQFTQVADKVRPYPYIYTLGAL